MIIDKETETQVKSYITVMESPRGLMVVPCSSIWCITGLNQSYFPLTFPSIISSHYGKVSFIDAYLSTAGFWKPRTVQRLWPLYVKFRHQLRTSSYRIFAKSSTGQNDAIRHHRETPGSVNWTEKRQRIHFRAFQFPQLWVKFLQFGCHLLVFHFSYWIGKHRPFVAESLAQCYIEFLTCWALSLGFGGWKAGKQEHNN